MGGLLYDEEAEPHLGPNVNSSGPAERDDAGPSSRLSSGFVPVKDAQLGSSLVPKLTDLMVMSTTTVPLAGNASRPRPFQKEPKLLVTIVSSPITICADERIYHG